MRSLDEPGALCGHVPVSCGGHPPSLGPSARSLMFKGSQGSTGTGDGHWAWGVGRRREAGPRAPAASGGSRGVQSCRLLHRHSLLSAENDASGRDRAPASSLPAGRPAQPAQPHFLPPAVSPEGRAHLSGGFPAWASPWGLYGPLALPAAGGPVPPPPRPPGPQAWQTSPAGIDAPLAEPLSPVWSR